MLTEICQYLRNWFDRRRYFGKFVIANGEIKTSENVALPILEGQYYRIVGSVFNDGVHKNGSGYLTDEPEFEGAVWLMAVPPDFLLLVDEISDWVEKNADALGSPYASESFGGYSYSLRAGNGSVGDSGASGGLSWQNQFAARLSPWRKI